MTGGVGGCSGDAGRAAVYEAEDAAFGGTDLERVQPLEILAGRAATICDGSWWGSAGGPTVRVLAARAGACSSTAAVAGRHGARVVIRLAAPQRTVSTLTHELAHALAGVAGGHGPHFRAAHVDLVAVLAGTSPAGQLRDAYRAFELEVADRHWPPPTVGEGPGFVWLAAAP